MTTDARPTRSGAQRMRRRAFGVLAIYVFVGAGFALLHGLHVLR
ncbi:MAG: hypothetical protein ACLPYS_08845 [Vulcanimicrobiaceae bacterium]